MTLRLLFAVLIGTALAGPSRAAEPRYVVTLKSSAAVAEPKAVAEDLAATYGARLAKDSPAHGEQFIMEMTGARVRLLTADPRVASVVAVGDPAATAVDTVNWTSGVPYEYDPSGNVKKIGNDRFAYDSARRLIQANVNEFTTKYEYDAFGNRTKCAQAVGAAAASDCQGGVTVNTAEKKNQLREAVYDARGNVTNVFGRVYTYDAANVVTAEQNGTMVREFVYGADDKRIAVHTVNTGSWRWTMRDPLSKVVREFSSQNEPGRVGTRNWSWSRDYVWRNGVLFATRQPDGGGTNTYHYHVDHLGTPRRITDRLDNTVGVHDYFAFGTEAPGGTNEPSPARTKFTGHERDSGLTASPFDPDYMLARYYSPMLGRFLSVDPLPDSVMLQIPQTWNRYTYALNNPLKYTDPTGMVPCDIELPDGRKVPGECIVVEAEADPVEEVPVDESEAQIAQIKAGQDMARYYLTTTVDNMIPEPVKGAGSYFRGIYRGANLILDASGVRGDCKQERVVSQLFLAGLVAAFGSPEVMADIAAEAIGRNKGYIAGRLVTGTAVTLLLGRAGGPTGARAGLGLGALAVAGDASHVLGEIADETFGNPCEAKSFE